MSVLEYYLELDLGELLGDPEWGCNLIDSIFRYNGVIVDPLIKEDILNAVSKYEPRVIMGEDDIVIINDIQTLHIFITYTIKETGEINEYNLEITPEDYRY